MKHLALNKNIRKKKNCKSSLPKCTRSEKYVSKNNKIEMQMNCKWKYMLGLKKIEKERRARLGEQNVYKVGRYNLGYSSPYR